MNLLPPALARHNSAEPRARRSRLSAAVLSCCALLLAVPAHADTFTNAIISDGADPWAIYSNGYYYLTHTTGSSVKLRTATRMAGTNGIGAVNAVTVFTPPPPYNKEVWAPELHFLRGKWYIYYAADDGTNANHRMFVAEQLGQTMSFTYKGRIYDPSTDCWAIDGTVLQAANGSLYFIWSGWPGGVDGLQNLYIAPMSDPWTISGPRVLLSTPELSWESWIQEGPVALQRNGKVFLVYAANRSWTDSECLGMLVNTDGNYLNPASWTKQPQPVFKTYIGPEGTVFGPGHCSFTRSLNGSEDWIFYHAAKYSGAGWTRSIRMQRFTWAVNGLPSFGTPIPAGMPITYPSGDDYSPSRIWPAPMQSNGVALVSATAPLPLLTNKWAVQGSADLTNWTTLTNVAGTQFSTLFPDPSGLPGRFYRVKSAR
jgi:GH43 family beta-xylosidase